MADESKRPGDGPITVAVGGETRHVPPFRGFKAVRAGRLLARVSDEVQRLWEKADAYVEEYKRTHTIRVTREEAAIRAAAGAPGWDQIEFAPDRPYIEYPGLPSTEQQFLYVFRDAIDLIEKELLQMLALVLAPNNELAEAMEDEGRGGVDGYLEREGQKLLMAADLGELVDVAVAAQKMLEREFEGKTEALAEMRNLLGPGPSRTTTETSTEEETPTTPTEESPSPSSSSTPREAQPESESASSLSQTSSDAPTDGPEPRSSSDRPGSNFVSSGTG